MALHKQTFRPDAGAGTDPDSPDSDELLYLEVRRFVATEFKNNLNQLVTVADSEEKGIERGCLRIEVLGLEEFSVVAITRRLQMTFGPSAEMRVELPAEPGVRAYLLIPRTGQRRVSGGLPFPFNSATMVLVELIVLLIVYLWVNDNDMFLIRSLKAISNGGREFMDSLVFPRDQ